MKKINGGNQQKYKKMAKMDVRTSKWKEELSQSREGRMRERGEVMLGRERVEGDRSIPE